MADSTKSPREVAAEVLKSVRDEIAVYEQGLIRMRAAEVGALKKSIFGLPQQAESNKQMETKVKKQPKTVFDILGKSGTLNKGTGPSAPSSPSSAKLGSGAALHTRDKSTMKPVGPAPTLATAFDSLKSEDYIDARGDADPAKRYVHVGAYDNKAEPKKEVPAPGSGGKLGKDKDLTKDAMAPEAKPAGQAQPAKAPTLKPAGVPGMKAGEAPKPPVAPSAPGMKKDELKPIGVFAKLAARRAQATAAQVGTPASQNLAAAKVLTQRVIDKKKSPVLGKEEYAGGQMDLAEKSERTVFDILRKNEELHKVAPPGFSEETMHKLKAKHGVESAFKIAWAAHNKKSKTKKSEEDMTCPYCRLHLGVCPC